MGPATDPSRQLVVRVDRSRVNRRFGLLTAINVAVLLGVLALMYVSVNLVESASATIPFAIVILGQVFTMAQLAWIWGVQIGVGIGMVVSAEGVSVPVPPYGTIGLPWAAVAGVRRRGPHLVINAVREVGPGSPGVSAPPDRRLWRRLHRRGALVPLKLVDTDLQTMSDALWALSGGQVAVQAA